MRNLFEQQTSPRKLIVIFFIERMGEIFFAIFMIPVFHTRAPFRFFPMRPYAFFCVRTHLRSFERNAQRSGSLRQSDSLFAGFESHLIRWKKKWTKKLFLKIGFNPRSWKLNNFEEKLKKEKYFKVSCYRTSTMSTYCPFNKQHWFIFQYLLM